jgi:hypothetical protein
VRGYLDGVIRVRFSVVYVIVSWKLVITFFFNAALVLESRNIACIDADWLGLL